MAGAQSIGEASDNPVAINVTAMVDVIFCLCLFFMCSFHFKQVQGSIDTWLPKGPGVFTGRPPPIARDEICVVLRWDPSARATVRNLRFQPSVASDGELMRDILQIADGYNEANNTTWPLVIDAAPGVPWQDVVHVMDLCKQNHIERIELAAPERAIE